VMIAEFEIADCGLVWHRDCQSEFRNPHSAFRTRYTVAVSHVK
jgi:hypothetical protein